MCDENINLLSMSMSMQLTHSSHIKSINLSELWISVFRNSCAFQPHGFVGNCTGDQGQLIWNHHQLGPYYQEWMPHRDDGTAKGNINGKDHFLQVSGLVWWTDGVQWINNDAGNIDRIFAADAKNEKLLWMWRLCELQLSVKPDCSFRSHLTLYNWAVLGKDVPDITQRKDDIETIKVRIWAKAVLLYTRVCKETLLSTVREDNIIFVLRDSIQEAIHRWLWMALVHLWITHLSSKTLESGGHKGTTNSRSN